MNILNFFILCLVFVPMSAICNTALPDPTRPASYVDEKSEPIFFEEVNLTEKINWELTAIRISDKDKTAILNGKLVRAGDFVGPAKIVEIKPLSIVINHEERKLIVRLYRNEVIKSYKSQK